MTCKKKQKAKPNQVSAWSSAAEHRSRGGSNGNKRENGQVHGLHSSARPRSLSAAVKVCVCASSVSLTHNYTIAVDTSQMSGSAHHTQCEVPSLGASTFSCPSAQTPSRRSLDSELSVCANLSTLHRSRDHRPSTQALQQA